MRTLPFVLLLTLGLCHGLFAMVVYVDDNASAGGDGTSWASAHKYLQDALADVNASDEIWVAEGTYKPDQGGGKTAGDRTASFNLLYGLGMYGGFKGTETERKPLGDGNQTILSGEIDTNSSLWSLHVVMGHKLYRTGTWYTTELNNFRITRGNANGLDINRDWDNTTLNHSEGGGLYMKSRDVGIDIKNCIFSDNHAQSGGGAWGIGTFTNCIFSNNKVTGNGWGGGFKGVGTFYSCVFFNNSAGTVDSHQGIGGAIHGSVSMTNCVLFGNKAKSVGSAIYINRSSGNVSGSLSLTNCVVASNYIMGGHGNAIEVGTGLIDSNADFENCIFWNNAGSRLHNVQPTHGIRFMSQNGWKGSVIEEEVISQFPGDPNAKGAILAPPIILQGWEDDERAISADPLFVNINDPDGPDDKWFTSDDGLRLKEGSPAIDAGHTPFLTEKSGEYDLAGYLRVQNGKVDLGAYEYGDLKVPSYLISLLSSPSGKGSLIGDGIFVEKGNSTTISATPNTGYRFNGWSGDATSTTNPLTLTVNADMNFTANFARDTNDDDGDGLSNYAELVTYGTDKTKADTDGDGISDGKEIEYGLSPGVSNSELINHIADLFSTPPVSASTQATPYTHGWYYQPNWGWIWTSKTTFPFVYRSSSDGKTEGWLYFKEGSASPILFYSYATGSWVPLGG